LAAERELPFFAISAVTGDGVEGLKYALARKVGELREAERAAAPANAAGRVDGVLEA
jgi:hypothetical protein